MEPVITEIFGFFNIWLNFSPKMSVPCIKVKKWLRLDLVFAFL